MIEDEVDILYFPPSHDVSETDASSKYEKRKWTCITRITIGISCRYFWDDGKWFRFFRFLYLWFLWFFCLFEFLFFWDHLYGEFLFM